MEHVEKVSQRVYAFNIERPSIQSETRVRQDDGDFRRQPDRFAHYVVHELDGLMKCARWNIMVAFSSRFRAGFERLPIDF
jgi:hypothetical protein